MEKELRTPVPECPVGSLVLRRRGGAERRFELEEPLPCCALAMRWIRRRNLLQLSFMVVLESLEVVLEGWV